MYVVWGCSSDSCHRCYWFYVFFFFFKQKTAYEMRISDWSSDVCSSDLGLLSFVLPASAAAQGAPIIVTGTGLPDTRSEEHTSELQSLMRISYAVFCLKKKKKTTLYSIYTVSPVTNNSVTLGYHLIVLSQNLHTRNRPYIRHHQRN